VSYPTTYSAIIAQANLARIANKVFGSVHGSNGIFDHQVTLGMEQQVLAWKGALPPYFFSTNAPEWFRGPRAVVLWKAQNLRLLLWRGGQRSDGIWPDKAEATRKCQLAAIETIHDISTFIKNHAKIIHLGLSWYATYFLFQATLVLLQSPEQALEDGTSSIWSASMTEARNCLSDLGGKNGAAKRCIAVLDRIHDHVASNVSIQSPGYADFPSASYTGHAKQTAPEAQAMYQGHLESAVDPALYIFLDNTATLNLFEGLQGFPSTQELESFDYVSGNLYNSEDAWNSLGLAQL